MALETLTLRNFQAHKDTSLELSPGVNIIWGETDHGKSSIIRAVRWVVLNRPSGEEFRRTESKLTSVTLETENFITLRRRSDTKNEYEMDDNIYKAVRTAVPEDISSALNITEANIQAQHQVYFLVDISPGQRSKILNEVAGLEIMDKVLKKANSDIRSITGDVRAKKKQIKTEDENIEGLAWATTADSFLKKLEAFENKYQQREDHMLKVVPICTAIEVLQVAKDKLLPASIETGLNAILRNREKIADRIDTIDHLRSLISKIETLQKQSDAIPVLNLSQLEKLQDTIAPLRDKIERVQDTLDELEFKKTQHKQVETMLATSEKKIQELLKKMGVCPTCDRRIK